jgi:formate dehydrogenase
MIAGFHTIAELPDEILTPGDAQIRALIVSCGNPVVTGPNGRTLDHALSTLELLVVHDLLQRESHQHAHWLIRAPHFLEREALLPVNGSNECASFAQLAFRVVEPPPTMCEEHEFFIDLAVAMDLPLLRGPHLRRKGPGRPPPSAVFDPHDLYRQMRATAGKVTLEELFDHPHGLIYGTTELGHMRPKLRTPDRPVEVAPADLVSDLLARLAEGRPEADRRYPPEIILRRRIESMNSWTNDLPSVHRRLPSNALEINPTNAAAAGVVDGSWVEVESPVSLIKVQAVVSDAVRPGVVVCERGWGANRNLLVDNRLRDPLSQVPAMSSQRVAVRPAKAGEERARWTSV